jgi:hypothetical protein
MVFILLATLVIGADAAAQGLSESTGVGQFRDQVSGGDMFKVPAHAIVVLTLESR